MVPAKRANSGMYVRVRVTPSAKKEQVTKCANGELDIRVREPRERNLANKRVRELVAEAFTVPLARVRLLAGHRSPIKMFNVEDY